MQFLTYAYYQLYVHHHNCDMSIPSAAFGCHRDPLLHSTTLDISVKYHIKVYLVYLSSVCFRFSCFAAASCFALACLSLSVLRPGSLASAICALH